MPLNSNICLTPFFRLSELSVACIRGISRQATPSSNIEVARTGYTNLCIAGSRPTIVQIGANLLLICRKSYRSGIWLATYDATIFS